tara:strand:- start:910 stop:1116 length:207 start_codon:yes stop_codon:yes gene_type:complete
MNKESYGLAFTEKQLKFMVRCIDIAQKSESIQCDAEESDLIRRLSKKYDELIDDEYSEYDQMEIRCAK